MNQTEQVIAYLVAAYPNATISAAGIAVYVDALSGVDPVLLLRIAKRRVLTSPFFPAVADLMRDVTAERLPIGANLTPEEAWADVCSRAPSHYAEGEAYAEANTAIGPFLRAVVREVGGWHAIQQGNAEQVRRAFIGAFRRMKDELVSDVADSVAGARLALEAGAPDADAPEIEA